jgi:hypothetical protein
MCTQSIEWIPDYKPDLDGLAVWIVWMDGLVSLYICIFAQD